MTAPPLALSVIGSGTDPEESSHIVTVLGKEYDLDHHCREIVQEWASSYAEEVLLILEDAGRSTAAACEIPEEAKAQFLIRVSSLRLIR